MLVNHVIWENNFWEEWCSIPPVKFQRRLEYAMVHWSCLMRLVTHLYTYSNLRHILLSLQWRTTQRLHCSSSWLQRSKTQVIQSYYLSIKGNRLPMVQTMGRNPFLPWQTALKITWKFRGFQQLTNDSGSHHLTGWQPLEWAQIADKNRGKAG